MSTLKNTDRARIPLGKRGAFEGVARRHGRRRNPARKLPRSSLRTPENHLRYSPQRWVERCDRSVANSETPQRQCPTESAGSMSLATGAGPIVDNYCGGGDGQRLRPYDDVARRVHRGPKRRHELGLSARWRHARRGRWTRSSPGLGRCWQAAASTRSAGECSDPRRAGRSTDAGGGRISSSPTRHRPTRPTRPTASFPVMSGTPWRPR
jgi:hypothetical protein